MACICRLVLIPGSGSFRHVTETELLRNGSTKTRYIPGVSTSRSVKENIDIIRKYQKKSVKEKNQKNDYWTRKNFFIFWWNQLRCQHKSTLSKMIFKWIIFSLQVAELEIEVKNYRDEVQTLTESARSNLAISLERDSLREKLNEMTSQQEGLLSKIDQLETSITQLKTEVRILVFVLFQSC